jgi:hypothetical protein
VRRDSLIWSGDADIHGGGHASWSTPFFAGGPRLTKSKIDGGFNRKKNRGPYFARSRNRSPSGGGFPFVRIPKLPRCTRAGELSLMKEVMRDKRGEANIVVADICRTRPFSLTKKLNAASTPIKHGPYRPSIGTRRRTQASGMSAAALPPCSVSLRRRLRVR